MHLFFEGINTCSKNILLLLYSVSWLCHGTGQFSASHDRSSEASTVCLVSLDPQFGKHTKSHMSLTDFYLKLDYQSGIMHEN